MLFFFFIAFDLSATKRAGLLLVDLAALTSLGLLPFRCICEWVVDLDSEGVMGGTIRQFARFFVMLFKLERDAVLCGCARLLSSRGMDVWELTKWCLLEAERELRPFLNLYVIIYFASPK